MVWMCGLEILIFQRLKGHNKTRKRNRHKKNRKIIITSSEHININDSNSIKLDKNDLKDPLSCSYKSVESFHTLKDTNSLSSDAEFFDCHAASPRTDMEVSKENTELVFENRKTIDRDSSINYLDFMIRKSLKCILRSNHDETSQNTLSTNDDNSQDLKSNNENSCENDLLDSPKFIGRSSSVLSSCLGSRSSSSLKSSRTQRLKFKLDAGSTFTKIELNEDTTNKRECISNIDPSTFKIRSLNYMKKKVKEASLGSFYELICSDLYSCENKRFEISKITKLPVDPYERTKEELDSFKEYGLPQILVVNFQIPLYEPSLFGRVDGPGHCFIGYFALPKGFNPRTFKNQAALGLLQRFFLNGREENSDQTRTRLKLIPKVGNLDEWAEKAPLTKTEHALVSKYNGKPLLTRPQHAFFNGPNYFEIDVDIHSWAYIARKAYASLTDRLKEGIWELALVIQGNRPEELPEYLLCCSRACRVDLNKMRPLDDFISEQNKNDNSYNNTFN